MGRSRYGGGLHEEGASKTHRWGCYGSAGEEGEVRMSKTNLSFISVAAKKAPHIDIGRSFSHCNRFPRLRGALSMSEKRIMNIGYSSERDMIRAASTRTSTVQGADENCFPLNSPYFYGSNIKTIGRVRAELAALD